MNVTIKATIDPEIKTDERPEPIRIIRHGEWVVLASEAELTAAERREMYCRMYNPCGVA